MLTDTAGYALRAVLYIARHDAEGLVPARVVAEALRVPANYLSKILHELAKRGVLASSRGARGGFRLGVRPDELRILAVVEPFEEMEPERVCLLGRPECSEADPCPAHHAWRDVLEHKREFLRTTTVAALLSGEASAR
ncbi:MAG: Rrf2 family transcriptional regulator [Gemmatimonadota bacterium]|nr:Rrf2 family transcriptional regulator [Gemmatimonadota bacterium]